MARQWTESSQYQSFQFFGQVPVLYSSGQQVNKGAQKTMKTQSNDCLAADKEWALFLLLAEQWQDNTAPFSLGIVSKQCWDKKGPLADGHPDIMTWHLTMQLINRRDKGLRPEQKGTAELVKRIIKEVKNLMFSCRKAWWASVQVFHLPKSDSR